MRCVSDDLVIHEKNLSGSSFEGTRMSKRSAAYSRCLFRSRSRIDSLEFYSRNSRRPIAPFAPAPQPIALRGTKLNVSKPGPSIGLHVRPSSVE